LEDAKKDKMRTYASSIASNAIKVHMYGGVFTLAKHYSFDVGLYDSRYNLLYGNELNNIDFSKVYYELNNCFYIIDQSAQMHMGIKYIVIKDNSIAEEIIGLKYKLAIITIIAMLFIAIIGYFLSRLFLQPIAAERQRLDNFIKDTTHELNTPIAALLMSVSSLKDEEKE